MQALEGRVAGGPDPERPGVVHRLDRDTSGLLLLARDEETHAALQAALRARQITREYLALVEGRPPARRGTIDAPLGRDRRVRTRMSSDTDDPHHAVTHFETERGAARGHAPAGHARDRPHAPDPRPPAGDRPSGRRRPGIRHARAGTASAGSSCTPPGSRSSIRRPARRWAIKRRCRMTWSRLSGGPRGTERADAVSQACSRLVRRPVIDPGETNPRRAVPARRTWRRVRPRLMPRLHAQWTTRSSPRWPRSV